MNLVKELRNFLNFVDDNSGARWKCFQSTKQHRGLPAEAQGFAGIEEIVHPRVGEMLANPSRFSVPGGPNKKSDPVGTFSNLANTRLLSNPGTPASRPPVEEAEHPLRLNGYANPLQMKVATFPWTLNPRADILL